MQLSKKAIDDFKQIYFEEFKVTLSDDEADKKGLELLNLINLIYTPESFNISKLIHIQ